MSYTSRLNYASSEAFRRLLIKGYEANDPNAAPTKIKTTNNIREMATRMVEVLIPLEKREEATQRVSFLLSVKLSAHKKMYLKDLLDSDGMNDVTIARAFRMGDASLLRVLILHQQSDPLSLVRCLDYLQMGPSLMFHCLLMGKVTAIRQLVASGGVVFESTRKMQSLPLPKKDIHHLTFTDIGRAISRVASTHDNPIRQVSSALCFY